MNKPTIKTDRSITLHADGTVSFWNVLTQTWARADKVSSAVLATMDADDRDSIRLHTGEYQRRGFAAVADPRGEESMVAAVKTVARGAYQRNLCRGIENLSGSSLQGDAKAWSGRYAASREALVERLEAAGLAREIKGAKGRRVLLFV